MYLLNFKCTFWTWKTQYRSYLGALLRRWRGHQKCTYPPHSSPPTASVLPPPPLSLYTPLPNSFAKISFTFLILCMNLSLAVACTQLYTNLQNYVSWPISGGGGRYFEIFQYFGHFGIHEFWTPPLPAPPPPSFLYKFAGGRIIGLTKKVII